MGAVWKYWRLVRINSAGQRQVEEIPAAKAFFEQQFPELAGKTEVPDAEVQRHLLQLMQTEATEKQRARCCLRCVISHQIDWVCGDLEKRFGEKGGFTRSELLPYVLDDGDVLEPKRNSRGQSSRYQSLATRILQSFDPEQSQLSTWTKRLVISQLNGLLLECGVYLVTDWAILNDMTAERLQRLLAEVYRLAAPEIERSRQLLESYHAVYRRDRLQQRQPRSRSRCEPPTPEQLHRMVEALSDRGMPGYSPQKVMGELQTLADRIRGSRIPKLEPLPEYPSLRSEGQALEADEEDTHHEFLTRYREEFGHCLERALEQVVSDRIAYHRQKQPPRDRQFLDALHLFYCRHQSMSEIAPQVGLHQQYQVSRLLDLKEFRADVRQKMLRCLCDRCRKLAAKYINPTQLDNLEQNLDAALEEEIDTLIRADAVEANTPNHAFTNLFARRLCRHLDIRRTQP